MDNIEVKGGDEAPSRYAFTRKGHDRATRILNTTIEIIVDNGLMGLSLRQVAQRCEMSLSNVQYYFATKEHLITGLASHILNRYEEVFRDLVGACPLSPEHQYKRVISFLLDDVKNPTTNAIFFQLWSFAQHSSFVNNELYRMYAFQRRWFEELMEKINPSAGTRKIALRAALITCQIEGLMVLLASGRPRHEDLHGLEQECFDQLLHLAWLAPDKLSVLEYFDSK